MNRENEMEQPKPSCFKGYDKFLLYAQEQLNNNRANTRYSIFYVDFNGFQMVNDIYGFIEGDRLLAAFADFLCELSGIVLCAHILADNYLCLFEDPRTRDVAQQLSEMERAMDCFLENQRIYHPNCKITANGGFCVIMDGENNLTEAVDNANSARKHAKQTGRVCITWFDANMRSDMRHRKEITAAIQAALRNEEFMFYLQPKVSLQTGKLVGAEVLARWRCADGTIISPDEFIPIMEKDHSIVELDFLIYRKAFEMIERRIQMDLPVVPLSLNVSRAHLDMPNLAERIFALASAYGVPPNLLEFEMTETMYVNNYTEMRNTVQKMHEYGYKVSIDDFGTGYSSLNMLQELSFDVLKLDKKFAVDNERFDRRSRIITAQIIEMANKLHISVLCEGVETLAQAEYLFQIGCDTAQGFYFDCPLTCDEFNRRQAETFYTLPWASSDAEYQEITTMPDQEIRAVTSSIFDVIQGAVIGIDLETYHVLFANNQLFELTGYARAELDIENNRQWYLHFMSKDTAKALQQIVRSCASCTTQQELEFPILPKNQQQRWLRMRSGLAYSPIHGRYLLCTFFDTTSEMEAARTDYNLQMLMDSLQSGIIRVAMEANGQALFIEIASESFYRLCGYDTHVHSANEMFMALFNDEELEILRNKLWMIAVGSATQLEYPIVHPNGMQHWHRLIGSRATQGEDNKWRLDCIISDITEEKTCQQQITIQKKQLNTFYKEVYSNAQCGIMQYTREHSHCIFINAYAAKVLGIENTSHFCQQSATAILHYVHKSDWRKLLQMIRIPEQQSSYEFRIKRADGEIGWLTGSSKLIVGEDGKEIMLYTFVDSTESNQIKQKFMRFNKRIAALLKAVIFEYDYIKDTLYFYQIENANIILPTHIKQYHQRTRNPENAPFQDGQQMFLDIPDDVSIMRDVILKRNVSSGGETWLQCSAYFERDAAGRKTSAIGFYRDVTAEQRVLQRETRRARLDQLTGVCERDTFESLCAEHLRRTSRATECAFFLLNLNDFTILNAEKGIRFGDSVLERIGALLLRDFHRGDIVGRINENCYAALLSGEVSLDITRARAEKICSAVAQLFRNLPFASGSCSIGIAYGHLACYDFNEVYQTAVDALYEVHGPNVYSIKMMHNS